MGYYMVVIGVVCLLSAIGLFISRLRFRAKAKVYSGKVIDLIIRNHNGISQSARNTLLLIEYHDFQGRKEYLCEDVVIAAFYHINDKVEILVGCKGKHEQVYLNNLFSLALPSIAFTVIGLGSLLGANSIFGWLR